MPARSYPLELVLTAHGTCELITANNATLWASDADDDFREEFNNEFLNEEDLEEILEYLEDNEILTEKETDNFVEGRWEFSVDVMEGEDDMADPGDDDGDDGEDSEE